MKEAMLWKGVGKRKVQCHLCARRCVIPEGKLGFCKVRENLKGILYTHSYGKVCSISVDPIEKKPLYHFMPQARTLSVATMGCNFKCAYCQNWQISQPEKMEGDAVSPKQIVALAKHENCKVISYTYTEPTIFFELAYETAGIAKRAGIKNTFVTNGYMTPEAVDKIAPYLDAATVNFKGSGSSSLYKRYSAVPDVKPIFESLLAMRKRGIFIEITDLIIPKIGDDMGNTAKLLLWVKDNLGVETPVHFLRFHPDHRMKDIEATPLEALEKRVEHAKKLGFLYVYAGNVRDSEASSTYCPKCGKRVIEREAMEVLATHLKGKACEYCGAEINLVVK